MMRWRRQEPAIQSLEAFAAACICVMESGGCLHFIPPRNGAAAKRRAREPHLARRGTKIWTLTGWETGGLLELVVAPAILGR